MMSGMSDNLRYVLIFISGWDQSWNSENYYSRKASQVWKYRIFIQSVTNLLKLTAIIFINPLKIEKDL
jgi:hypothetical protein